MSDLQPPSDDLGLVGKVAIVTGGGAPDDGIGNGRAAAMLLARAGVKVLVVDIIREAAEQTVAMIDKEGGEAAPFVADVGDEAQCRACRSRGGAIRPSRPPRQQCRNRRARQRRRHAGRGLATRHANQC